MKRMFSSATIVFLLPIPIPCLGFFLILSRSFFPSLSPITFIIIRLWLELGGRGIDTALMYGDDAQEEVGAAVKWGLERGTSFSPPKYHAARKK